MSRRPRGAVIADVRPSLYEVPCPPSRRELAIDTIAQRFPALFSVWDSVISREHTPAALAWRLQVSIEWVQTRIDAVNGLLEELAPESNSRVWRSTNDQPPVEEIHQWQTLPIAHFPRSAR